MIVHGSVNHTLWRSRSSDQQSFSGHYSDMFVATHNFLNSANGAALGVVRRACNFNNSTANCDYASRKSFPKPGDNAWALFEFTSASPKFWLLIQTSHSDTTVTDNFGNSPGNPASLDWIKNGVEPYFSQPSFAFSVAVREDGGDPWNGTLNNNGLDTKGSVVWVPGPSRLSIFPLVNGSRGHGRVSRSIMHPLMLTVDPTATITRRNFFHVLATEDSITFLASNDGGFNYNFAYLGRYNPINNTGACYCFVAATTVSLGYILAVRARGTNNIIFPWSSGGGPFAVHPSLGNNAIGMNFNAYNALSYGSYVWSGGIIDRNSFSSVPIGLGRIFDIGGGNIEYSRKISTNSALGKIDVYNIPVYLDGGSRALVGEISNIKSCHTLGNHSTIHRRKYAVFGRYKNEGKILTLWGGDVIPGRPRTVYGEQF